MYCLISVAGDYVSAVCRSAVISLMYRPLVVLKQVTGYDRVAVKKTYARNVVLKNIISDRGINTIYIQCSIIGTVTAITDYRVIKYITNSTQKKPFLF